MSKNKMITGPSLLLRDVEERLAILDIYYISQTAIYTDQKQERGAARKPQGRRLMEPEED
jgi:hypothetical protein